MKTNDCTQIAKYLEQYIDNALSGEEQTLLLAHLEHCIECQRKIKTLKEVNDIGRIAFYPDPGERYWATLTARIMEHLPHEVGFKERFYSTLNDWLRTPVLVRNFALSSAAVLLIVLIIKFIPFPDSDQKEMVYKLTTESKTSLSQQQDPLSPAGSELGNKAETAKNTIQQKSGTEKTATPGKSIRKPINNRDKQKSEEQLAGNVDVPFVPKQLNVTPKQPSSGEEKTEMKIPSSTKNEFAIQNTAPSEKQKNDSKTESFDNLSSDIQSGHSVISPRLPKQGISSFENGKTTIPQGFSIGNDVKEYGNNGKSSTLLNEKSTRYKDKQRSAAALNTLSIEDLIQKKIILREVLFTGKDAKIQNIALLKLDEIYQALLERESSQDLYSEAKEFYDTHRKPLIDVLGIQEYEIRMTRFR